MAIHPPVTRAELGDSGCRFVYFALQVVSAAAAADGHPNLEDLLVCDSWKKQLNDEFSKAYMVKLQSYLEEQWGAAKVFPPPHDIFRALNTVPFDR